MLAGAVRRHKRVRPKDSDVVAVQKPTKRLKLPLGRHNVRKAFREIEREPFADALQASASPLVAQAELPETHFRCRRSRRIRITLPRKLQQDVWDSLAIRRRLREW
jgi:hypothetical protein